MNYKKTAVATALAATLGMGAVTVADAAIIEASWAGLFTILNSDGNPVKSVAQPYYDDPTWGYGYRTPISGTLIYDTDTGVGAAIMNSFEFMDPPHPGPSTFRDIVLQAVGDGSGGAGTLVVGKMLWDWGGNYETNLGIVLDAAGFFSALGSGTVITGSSISGVGAIPASNGIRSGKYPIGPAPVATTSYDTSYHNDPYCVMTASCIIGDDGVGGVPMDNGPFETYSVNFDFTSIHVDSVSEVPLPAAFWLLGSGLLGFVGVGRRRRQD
jgi:hypothetical protein